MTITTWLLIAFATVWAIGIPVVYGAEPRRTAKPELWLCITWPLWFNIWLLGGIGNGLRFAVLHLWQTLEAVGYAWAASDRRA